MVFSSDRLAALRGPWLRLTQSSGVFLAVEWTAALALLALAGVLVWLAPLLPGGLLVLLWTAWLALLVGLRAAGLFRLFGPVLYYDLVRTTRRTRYFLIRCLYGGCLLALVVWTWMVWLLETPGGQIPARALANYASGFFYAFMIVQLAAVLLLTPGYTAGAIAEEKTRRTLEFLLATDLRNREILLSKLATRLLNLTLLLLTGLPILSMLQFLGGVDPNLVLAGFAVTALTMASLAGLGIFCSVYSRRPIDAIALTYVATAAYLLLSGFAQILVRAQGVDTWQVTPDWAFALTLGDLANGFAAGNLISALVELSNSVASGSRLEDVLLNALGGYALVHGVLAVGLPLWATFRLRAVALKENRGAVRQQGFLTRLLGRPGVQVWPMLWKEVIAEPGLRLNWLARLIVGLLLLASFLPVPFILYDVWEQFERPSGPRIGPWSDFWYVLGENMNAWVRIVGALVASLLLLAVAVRAAGSISGERDRRTLDELLTTPLSAEAILVAKWLGSVLSVRWGWLWLGLIALGGLLTGGLHPLALPVLLIVWLVYAGFAAALGLWFSVTCRTTLRATLWTLATLLAVSVGHWLLTSLGLYMPLAMLSGYSRNIDELISWMARVEAGQTPPFVLGFLAFWHGDFQSPLPPDPEMWKLGPCCFVGVCSWAVFAVLLGLITDLRFAGESNRRWWMVPSSPRPSARPRLPTAAAAKEEVLEVLPIVEPSTEIVVLEDAAEDSTPPAGM